MKKNKSKVLMMILAFTIFIGGNVYAGYNGWLNVTWNAVPDENTVLTEDLISDFSLAINNNAIENHEVYGRVLKPQNASKPKIISGNEVSTTSSEICFAADSNLSVIYENVGVSENTGTNKSAGMDVRLSISNIILPENPTSSDPSLVCVKTDNIGFTINELLQVDWKIEYLKSGSDIPVSVNSSQKINGMIDGKYVGFNESSFWNFRYTSEVAKTMKYSKGSDNIKYIKNDIVLNNVELKEIQQDVETAFTKYNSGPTESGVFGTESDNIKKSEMDFDIRTVTNIEKVQILKSVEDENKDKIVQPGEKVVYSIELNSKLEYEGQVVADEQGNDQGNILNIFNVPVRDNLVENTPDYYTFNNDIKVYKVDGEIITEITDLSGDITKGDFKINEYPTGSKFKIVYSFTASDTTKMPSGDIVSVSTDNGGKPTLCEKAGRNCAFASILAKPETTIKLNIIDENKDNIVQSEEVLTHQIEVENKTLVRPSFLTEPDIEFPTDETTRTSRVLDKAASGILYNVRVRSDLIENNPNYLKYNNDVKVYDVTGGKKVEITDYTGSLLDGTFTLNKMPSGTTFMLEFTTTSSNAIDQSIDKVIKRVTDNGTNPLECTVNTKDCFILDRLVEPETIIRKSVTDSGKDNIAHSNEVLKYQVEVENQSTSMAKTNVKVRVNLLEKTPEYLTFNNDVKVYSITNKTKTEVKNYSGNLKDGTFVINKIPANTIYMLEYTIKTSNTTKLPKGNIVNIATDNGINPSVCTANSRNCAITSIETMNNSVSNEDYITVNNKNNNIDNKIETKTIVLPKTGTSISNLLSIVIISSTLIIVRKQVIK